MFRPRFVAAIAAGAAIMYFMDPVSGRGRRHRCRDQLGAARRRTQRAAERQERYAAGWEEGQRAKARGAGQFHPTDDRSIELHLHDVLAHLDVDSRDVNLEVVEGLARVRGQVKSQRDADRIVEAVGNERGVREVESWLHLPGEPAPNKQPARVAGAR
jgi:BON domain-containing protein